jgi:hypothetical protein
MLTLNTVSLVVFIALKKDKFVIEGFKRANSITVDTIVTIRLKPINLFLEVIKKE